MNFKKTSAALMAAAVLAVAAPMTGVLPDPLSIVANAAEAKLVTGSLDAAISEKIINGDFIYLGKGYYILQDVISYSEFGEANFAVNKIIRFGDKEIEQWRTTGKLEPTTVQCDVDVSGMKYLSGGFKNGGSYVMFGVMGEEETPGHCYVLKLDETAGKLVKAYDYVSEDFTSSWVSGHCTASGESFLYWDGPALIGLRVFEAYTSTGQKFEIGSSLSWSFCDGADKYMGYMLNCNFDDENPTAFIDGICKDGNLEKIYEFSYASYPSIGRSGSTWVSYSVDSNYYILDTKNGQLHNLGEIDGFVTIDNVNGSAVTVKWFEYDENYNAAQCYKLIDLNGKDLSKTYANMETYDDGNTYLVKTADGKWGYIDSTGKELAMFDDAGSFSSEGLYAPVVKDGKGWLVDKNMNQVSEKIDAVGCTTFNAGQLIRFVTAKDSNGNETADVWVTTAANGSSSTETPTNPTVTTKQQSFHDDKTNITVDGKFPENTTLKTEAKQNSDNKVSWDITLTDASGKKVQPEGNATVKLPLPETFKGKTVYVYRVENGKYTALESAVEGNYIVFKTNHFSEYVLTTEKVEEKPSDNPNTGVSAAAAFGIVALTGAFIIVSKKRR